MIGPPDDRAWCSWTTPTLASWVLHWNYEADNYLFCLIPSLLDSVSSLSEFKHESRSKSSQTSKWLLVECLCESKAALWMAVMSSRKDSSLCALNLAAPAEQATASSYSSLCHVSAWGFSALLWKMPEVRVSVFLLAKSKVDCES